MASLGFVAILVGIGIAHAGTIAVAVVSNLLYLSNELHGSKSNHLFGQVPPVERHCAVVQSEATVTGS
jgi:hypothetical protein